MITDNKILGWIKLIAVSVLIIAVIASCTKNFDKYNTNQNEATETMMGTDNLKTGAFFTQMQRNVVLFKDGTNLTSDYQVAQGLTSDVYSGYIAPTGTWYGGVHNGAYYFIVPWIEKTFTSGFASVMPAWQSITKIATDQKLPEIAALAAIVKVEAMHRVASVPWGINSTSSSPLNNCLSNSAFSPT